MIPAILWTVCSLLLAQAGEPTGPGLPPGTLAVREKAVEALAARLDVETGQVSFVDEWPVVWPDTSLGVPEPEMVYATVLVPGSMVVLRAGEQLHAYHAARTGRIVYAGLWQEGRTAQLADLPGLAEGDAPPRIDILGTLVYVQGEALLYEGSVEPANLPKGAKPAHVQGIALAPFVERNWKDAAEGSVPVRITARPARALATPLKTGVEPCARLLAERIRIQSAPARPVGLVTLQQATGEADRFHGCVVTLQGVLRTSFERSELEEQKPSTPPLPPIWVDGDLSGLPRASGGETERRLAVEVTGLFERRLRFDGTNGYGPAGTCRYRLEARACHALSEVLDYADLVDRADSLSGSLVAVRGQLFLGAGLSDLTSLALLEASRRDPGCLVTGDLSGLALADPVAQAAGVPVLVDGRLEVAPPGKGFGRGDTRRLRVEATCVRLLDRAELPTEDGAAPALEAIAVQEDGTNALVRCVAGSNMAPIAPGVTCFAVRRGPEGDTRALALVTIEGFTVYQEAPDGTRTRVDSGASVSAISYSPSGRWLALIVDNRVRVYDVASCAEVAMASPEGKFADLSWSPLGDVLLCSAGRDGAGEAGLLDPGTQAYRPLDDPDSILGWWPENGRLLRAQRLERPQPEPEELAAETVLAVATAEDAADAPVEITRGEAGERILGLVRNPKHPLAALVTVSPEHPGAMDLYLVPMGTEGPRRMCYMGATEIRDVLWSADGESIAFLARQGEVWHALLMNAAGRKLVDLRGVLPCRPALDAPGESSTVPPGRETPGEL